MHSVSQAFQPKYFGEMVLLRYKQQEHTVDEMEDLHHGVAKSQTRLSDFTFTFYFHILKKEMATQSSVLAWKIPWMEEPSRLQFMGSQRVRHD